MMEARTSTQEAAAPLCHLSHAPLPSKALPASVHIDLRLCICNLAVCIEYARKVPCRSLILVHSVHSVE